MALVSDPERLDAVGQRRIEAQLQALGICSGDIHRNLPPAELTSRSLAKSEGILAANGALVVATGERTGRSPLDRFIVRDDASHDVDWGDTNRACDKELFEALLQKASRHLNQRTLFVFDGTLGAQEPYTLPVRVITCSAWRSLFASTLLRPPGGDDCVELTPEFTVVDCGDLQADPRVDGTRSTAFVAISFERRLVLILGTMYAGEIKKALFTVMNYLLPERGVLPMHCAANVGAHGDTALFFGLSGTGKTSLSADPARRLVGDDEHGWCDQGIFNFEGGCYAKTIRLSPLAEPQIYDAIRFGSVLENVQVDPLTRAVEWDDESITENTRATYPIAHIPGAIAAGVAGHPSNIFFLACDAYGVLPPIARLDPPAASYFFLSGFTAKVAGTESGVTEPQPTFSTCFGAPFMPRDPTVYASLLARRVRAQNARCWLVNTGWSGGPYGIGQRMPISVTRSLIRAALEGLFEQAHCTSHPVFGISVPSSCPGVDNQLLDPCATWSDANEYKERASSLARLFEKNFARYEARVSAEVAAAGPRLDNAPRADFPGKGQSVSEDRVVLRSLRPHH